MPLAHVKIKAFLGPVSTFVLLARLRSSVWFAQQRRAHRKRGLLYKSQTPPSKKIKFAARNFMADKLLSPHHPLRFHHPPLNTRTANITPPDLQYQHRKRRSYVLYYFTTSCAKKQQQNPATRQKIMPSGPSVTGQQAAFSPWKEVKDRKTWNYYTKSQ